MLKYLIPFIPLSIIKHAEHFLLADYQRTLKALETCDPDLLHAIGNKKALALFKKVAKVVPAYKNFLKKQKCNPKNINSIEEFDMLAPITGKKNYVKSYTHEQRCLNGKLPSYGNIDESSGSSGAPTNWIRSVKEEGLLSKAAEFEFNYIYRAHKTNFIVLSAWSCGPWATGIKFCQLMEHYSLVKNTDTNVKNIIRTIKMFGAKKHYLIAGYPPFLKHMLDSKGIDWKAYNIDLLTGGEGTTLEWNVYMKKRLKKNAIMVSSYGASDIDIGIGFETPLACFIRELCQKNKELSHALFGNLPTLPMIFQYNPTMHHITNYYNKKDKKPEFIVTLLDENVVSPKIRYNINDEGGVHTYRGMIEIIKKFHPNYLALFRKNRNIPEEVIHLPFLFVAGRTDGTISLDGANVYPHQIEICLHKNKELMGKVHHFKITKKERKNRDTAFTIKIELKRGVRPTPHLSNKIRKSIETHLPEINQDYKESYAKNKDAVKPHVQLFLYSAPEFSQHAGRAKRKYID